MAARNPFASSVPDIFDPYALVQSRRPVHSTGYYFVKNLLLVGAVAGGVVALYRNDVFLELARRTGQEQRYLEAEKFLVGTPGWGTPRSMLPVLNHADDAVPAAALGAAEPAGASAPSAPASTSGSDTTATSMPAKSAPGETVAALPLVERRAPEPELPAAPAARLAATTAAAPVAAPQPAPPAAAPARRSASDSTQPVSFDSLPVMNRGGVKSVAAAEPPPARVASAPTHAPAPVAHAPAAAPAPRPLPVDHSHAKAIKVTLEETPAPASHRAVPLPTHAAAPPPEPPPAPKPVAAKPEPPKPKASDVHDGDNPLLAAVRGAVRKHPPKSSVPGAE